MLFARLLNGLNIKGELTVIDAAGKPWRFGAPRQIPSVTIRLHDRRLHGKLFLNPRLYLGEAYMDGTLTVEDGSLYDFLELLGANLVDRDFSGLDRWLIRTGSLWRRFARINPLARAQSVGH